MPVCQSTSQDLIDELFDFLSGLLQYLFSLIGGFVVPTHFPVDYTRTAVKEALALHTVECRVKRTRADIISVATQFPCHFHPEHWLFCSMVEDVDLYETEEELPVYHIRK